MEKCNPASDFQPCGQLRNGFVSFPGIRAWRRLQRPKAPCLNSSLFPGYGMPTFDPSAGLLRSCAVVCSRGDRIMEGKLSFKQSEIICGC